MKTYSRVQTVLAEEINEYSFLLAYPKGLINGERKVGHRPGYRIVENGAVSFMEKSEFEAKFREVAERDGRMDVVNEIISAGVRSLARVDHPDVGGNHEQMSKLNSTADWLRAIAERSK